MQSKRSKHSSDEIAEREQYFIHRVRFREWCFSQLQTKELATGTISLYSGGDRFYGDNKMLILLIKVGCRNISGVGVFVSATIMMRSTGQDPEWWADYVRSVRSEAAILVLL